MNEQSVKETKTTELELAHSRVQKMREQLGVLDQSKRMLEEQQHLINKMNRAEKMAELEYEVKLREQSLERLERQEQMAMERHKNTLDYERRALGTLAEELGETDSKPNVMFKPT